MKKKGFTLIELLVVVAIIAMLLAILMPALNKVKKIAQRVVCGTNLKGLGNAMVVYANDYDGQYVCQGTGTGHTWERTTVGWQNPSIPWQTARNITVGASLYLLVRQADVSPKSFVCPSSDQHEFSGKNPQNYDIVELNDFGQDAGSSGYNSTGMDDDGSAQCVSYSYHMPYAGAGNSNGSAAPGRYRADDQRSAAFAIMADRNPWFDPKLGKVGSSTIASSNMMETVGYMGRYYDTAYNEGRGITERQGIMVANAQPHEREGQNVLFADGHSSFEKTPDVGVKNDNIYVPTNSGTDNDPLRWRVGYIGGISPVPAYSKATLVPTGMEDSFLVNDFIPFTRD